MEFITSWFKQHFSNPQVVYLGLFLLVLFAVLILMGQMIGPVLVGIVIAYLLEGLVSKFEGMRAPRFIAVLIVFIVFLLFFVVILFGLLPLVSQQATQFVQQIPNMLGKGHAAMLKLPDMYPDLVSQTQIDVIMTAMRLELTSWGQAIVSISMSSVVGLITVIIYLVLLPLLVFFFLKDKQVMMQWLSRFVPKEHQLVEQVWIEVDRQIGNYVRGKFWEIVVVWFACQITFSFLGLEYATLLAMLVALSVLIPYVGAAVVTIPVVLVAWFQWGWGSEFGYLFATYVVIQLLDGNLLVPILFSEVNNLHPVAIISAVLIFGSLWGLIGVFFAIPLATLVHAVINAWPKNTEA